MKIIVSNNCILENYEGSVSGCMVEFMINTTVVMKFNYFCLYDDMRTNTTFFHL